MSATTTTPQTNLMTQAGHDRLILELERLRTQARARTDPHERTVLDNRIAALEDLLAEARIVDAPADGSAGPGTVVWLRTSSGEVRRYEIVGAGEADGSPSRLSINSPVGQALLGRRPGDRIEAHAPRRTRRLELLAVEPIDALTEAA